MEMEVIIFEECDGSLSCVSC